MFGRILFLLPLAALTVVVSVITADFPPPPPQAFDPAGPPPPPGSDYDGFGDLGGDYYYDGEEIDDCELYIDEHPLLGDCHHGKFPEKTIEDVVGTGKVKKCCRGHQYQFYDHCDVSDYWSLQNRITRSKSSSFPGESQQGHDWQACLSRSQLW